MDGNDRDKRPQCGDILLKGTTRNALFLYFSPQELTKVSSLFCGSSVHRSVHRSHVHLKGAMVVQGAQTRVHTHTHTQKHGHEHHKYRNTQ